MTIASINAESWQPASCRPGCHPFRIDCGKTGQSAVAWSAWVVQGSAAGPVFLVTAGVHGDEYEGMEGIRRFVEQLDPASLRGTVIGIPLVNERAFEAMQRTHPGDQLDLARAFPGKFDGRPTERLAWALRHCVLPQCDFYCDIHAAGIHYEIAPLTGYQLGEDSFNERQYRACAAFGLPIIWATGYLPGRSLSAAREAGVPAIYAEYAGGGDCRAADVAHCAEALQRVAAALGMLEPAPQLPFEGALVQDDSDQAGHLQAQGRAPASGFFRPRVKILDRVRRGDLLAEIADPLGRTLARIEAEQDGRVVMLRKTRYLRQGESGVSIIAMQKVKKGERGA